MDPRLRGDDETGYEKTKTSYLIGRQKNARKI